MKPAHFLLLMSFSLNSLPSQYAQKSPNLKPENSANRAMGPCFEGRKGEPKCGDGFECDVKDNLCKKSSTAKKISLLAVSVRKKRQTGATCSNGFSPVSQCFVDNTCGYQPQYRCENGPKMKVCCPSTNPQFVQTQPQQQQQQVTWQVPTGGCRPPGCNMGCVGGCQQQQQQVQYQLPQQTWLPAPQPNVVQTTNLCPPFYQDIGQCYYAFGSCSTSGNGQCFGTRCCEPTVSTTAPGTTSGCMYYVPQLGRSFDICTGNTKCINGQCVPVQVPSTCPSGMKQAGSCGDASTNFYCKPPGICYSGVCCESSTPVTPPVTTSCVPNPCPNFYNQMNMCCWQKRRK